MRNSARRFIIDLERIRSAVFAEGHCRQRAADFIRRRKMPLDDLMYTILNRRGMTLALELRNYMNIAHPGEQISKPGYLKQRQKLNSDAFVDLYHFHNRNFYSEPGYSTYKGYLILAADGSDINIPTTTETLALYGSASKKDAKPQAQIGLGVIYDVLNKMILESDCNRAKFDEMRVAEKQLERLPETIGEHPYIMIMDRGYPSTPAFIHMVDKGVCFLVRLKKSDYKREQQSLQSVDTDVDIVLDKTRIRHYQGTPDGDRMSELGKIRLRMIKVLLENGETEVLATNVSSDVLSADDIKELYSMRWGIETAFETLKDRLQLENFTATKPLLLLQDIYSTIYLSNVAEDIIRDVEAEMDEKDKNRKHKMAINKTLSIGILKNDLIFVMLEPDDQKRDAFMLKIYRDISRNLVPVRPDRHYTRRKIRMANNFSNTHKRAY